MRIRLVILATALSVSPPGRVRALAAQTPAEHVALGDKANAGRNAADALRHYEAAIAADSSDYAALWKAAREAVDLGEAQENDAARTALYRKAERYARRAVAVNPKDAEGHFHLARSIGKNALTMGKRDRVKYAAEVRQEALTALELNPNHAGALHVMGIWNAEVMRLSGVTRFLAKKLLGGKVFDEASWASAVSYMERAVASEPDRIVHHVDLGMIYKDVDESGKAREQLETALKLPVRDVNDPMYKREAERALAGLR